MKKNFIILTAVIIAVLAAAGFLVYKNLPAQDQGQPQESVQLEQQNPEIQVQVDQGGIKAEGSSGLGSLTICQDKCGDGVCQKTDPNCKPGDLACVCLEAPQDCPQDCK